MTNINGKAIPRVCGAEIFCGFATNRFLERTLQKKQNFISKGADFLLIFAGNNSIVEIDTANLRKYQGWKMA